MSTPPHFYIDNSIYFLVASTKEKKKFFNSDIKKSILKKIIGEAIQEFDIDIYSWVILDNHYQLLFGIKIGKNSIRFLKKIHGKTAIEINKLNKTSGRKIFQNYWDHSIRNEKDFWMHFNYNHHNPIKHGYVAKMEDYKFSSYNFYVKKYGKEWIDSCFEFYPIIDFTPFEDDF